MLCRWRHLSNENDKKNDNLLVGMRSLWLFIDYYQKSPSKTGPLSATAVPPSPTAIHGSHRCFAPVLAWLCRWQRIANENEKCCQRIANENEKCCAGGDEKCCAGGESNENHNKNDNLLVGMRSLWLFIDYDNR